MLVNPLRKEGAKDDTNNYRPISILPTLSKLLEKFIQIKFTNFLNEYDVLHQTHGWFRSKHSTETALTFMTENWLKAIKDGKIVGTIMVDFRKAFDLADHGLLLENSSYYKCSETFITLMKSYLANRTQVVSVNSKLSTATEINCEVPQGSFFRTIVIFGFYQ